MKNLKIGIWEFNFQGIKSDNYSISTSLISTTTYKEGVKVWSEPAFLYENMNYPIQALLDLIEIMAIARIQLKKLSHPEVDSNTIGFLISGGSELFVTDTRLFDYRAEN
ncbi:hypothetical protein [Salegentibacter mishustinae]|uniref:hypothetical protein n=1 Tax=Salegentibacter mishustinae TaxID=270918 RepID=UPI002492A997|nr:hypothetical protein [Salegentibacter mishustinae]